MWLGKNDWTLRWVSQHPSQPTFLWQKFNPPQAKSWWTLTCRHHWTHKDVTNFHRVVHDNCHYKQKEKLKMCTWERVQWPAVWVDSSVAEVTSYLDIYSKAIVLFLFGLMKFLILVHFLILYSSAEPTCLIIISVNTFLLKRARGTFSCPQLMMLLHIHELRMLWSLK